MESESEPLLQNTSVETDSQNALFAMRKIKCTLQKFLDALLNILKADLPT